MVNRYFSIIMLLVICNQVVDAQKISLRAEAGIGTFYMEELKDFQKSVIPELGVNVESLSKFPPWFGYGISMLYFFRSGIGLGITSDYFSTGGRNYYKDYSGSYKFDFLAHAINLGAIFSTEVSGGKHLTSRLEIHQGIKLSRLRMNEEMVVTDPMVSESLRLSSTSWWIRPVYRIEYNIFSFLSAGSFIGCEINPGSKLHLKNNKDAILLNEQGGNVKINWSGVRFGLYLTGYLSGH